jgi:hypothetical protein
MTSAASPLDVTGPSSVSASPDLPQTKVVGPEARMRKTRRVIRVGRRHFKKGVAIDLESAIEHLTALCVLERLRGRERKPEPRLVEFGAGVFLELSN